MRSVRIDFSPRGLQRAVTLTSSRVWLMAGIGVLMCLSGVFAVFQQADQGKEALEQLEQLQSAANAPVAIAESKNTPSITAAEATAVNDVIQQLNIPWVRLLAVFDRLTPASIALLELVPDAKKHVVRGAAEARNADAMLDYIKKLKQQREFGNVVLTRHDVNAEDDNKPLRFEFEATWPEAEP